ncbi:G-protein coupled receptor GRL101-like protein [Dinothrombium tinctorium]|uniref:G-protein coupled receptor GRL101-like protein n=1 Tax=Dinothrombium tinctorium TaxID=1965070 RepID=A0A3S3SGP3_9ACAR|nr:G-protein coupled receptor GRL101-like protein [Dinothrombium tinctorium]
MKQTNCQRIQSHNYPDPYENSFRGRWIINAPDRHYINLTVNDFDVPSGGIEEKCMFDHLMFIDSSSKRVIGKYCNSQRPPKHIVSSWNQLQIDFNTDSNVTGRGFSFNFKTETFKLLKRLQTQLQHDETACPDGWSYYDGHCYKSFIRNESLQWYEAQEACKNYKEITKNGSLHVIGGTRRSHLVSIFDSDEMKVVYHFLINVWNSPPFTKFYIGLIDAHKEGSYRWVGNNEVTYPMSYTDWAPQGNILANDAQPDGGAYEDCTILHLETVHSTANWHDIHCSLGEHILLNVSSVTSNDVINGFICKMDASESSLINHSVREPLYNSLHLPDETAIIQSVVKERYFVCENMEVISITQRCDGTAECRDGSDESNGCPLPGSSKCLPSQFKCFRGGCTSISTYCDFSPKCVDGSDEQYCKIRKCKSKEFTCLNKQCIPGDKRCDLLPDCADGSDEGESCKSGRHCNRIKTFQCYYGNCIPWSAVCDSHRDCPGKFYEDEQAVRCDGSQYSQRKNITETFKCQSGQVIDAKLRCIYEFDQYGFHNGCRDVTHLRDCEHFTCGHDYVKCPKSYCIPPRYICDSKYDCPDGADEIHCGNYTCPGMYRCIKETSCILLHQLCDGIRHCSMGDDEWFCDVTCPKNCSCSAYYVSCENAKLTELPPNITKKARKLDLSNNFLGPDLSTANFDLYPELGELILQNNRIEVLKERKFVMLSNLYKLDLSNNHIKVIKLGAFAGLENVRSLLLENNPDLHTIEPLAFVGLKSLKYLKITQTNLTKLVRQAFSGMSSLQKLQLRNNKLTEIETNAFSDLESLTELDIRENQVKVLDVNGVSNVQKLYTDSIKFCCLVSSFISKDNCWPKSDGISDCEDLMSSPIQRTFLWIIGVIALLCNISVIIWRIHTRLRVNPVSSTLILSLGCSDFLMGIYLLLIALVDVYYRGRYMEVSDYWRNSTLCKICGVISTVSSEASVFTLVFIALDRLICICFPFSKYKFTLNFTYKLIFLSWSLAIVLSTVPFLVEPYFKNEFYARSGVCLPLHITNDNATGWEYSVAIFLCTNLIAFLIIVLCYGFMYKTVRHSTKRMKRIMARQYQERQVGRQMAFIVMTNFLCWFPIIIMGLLAISGFRLTPTVYSWTAVFILPLNSATDPIIYTLSQFKLKKMLFRKCKRSYALSKLNITKANSASLCKQAQSFTPPTPNERIFKPPHGYMPLMQFLKETENLEAKHLLQISCSLSDLLKDMHTSGYSLGGIDANNVFVSSLVDSDYLRVYLPEFTSYRVHSSNKDEEFAGDIEEFGLLVKRMLRFYQIRMNKNSSLMNDIC